MILFSSCDLEKEVELNLPEYERELVVECWLEPGKPYRLSLTESVGYFDSISLPIISDATVYIVHQGDTVYLLPIPSLDEGRLFNYTALETVPADYSSDFLLFVSDPQGRTVTGRTQILPPVPIDTLEYEFNDKDSALVRCKFRDNVQADDFYLFTLHENSLSKRRELAFEITDRVAAPNGDMLLSTLYFRQRGDTAIVTLYHVTQEVFDYIQSGESAEDANGNPFAPPTAVYSNVQGGIGIFAGLPYDRDSVIIQ
jgi:hypothetical protein